MADQRKEIFDLKDSVEDHPVPVSNDATNCGVVEDKAGVELRPSIEVAAEEVARIHCLFPNGSITNVVGENPSSHNNDIKFSEQVFSNDQNEVYKPTPTKQRGMFQDRDKEYKVQNEDPVHQQKKSPNEKCYAETGSSSRIEGESAENYRGGVDRSSTSSRDADRLPLEGEFRPVVASISKDELLAKDGSNVLDLGMLISGDSAFVLLKTCFFKDFKSEKWQPKHRYIMHMDCGIVFENGHFYALPSSSHWDLELPTDLITPIFDFTLEKWSKKSTEPEVYQAKFKQISALYTSHKHIYIDGSQTGERAGAAAQSQNEALQLLRLLDGSKIYEAEIEALYLALNLVEMSNSKKFLIISDSLCLLKALQNGPNIERPYILKILLRLTNLVVEKKVSIKFCWVPSHMGIPGNVYVDKLAKLASRMNIPIKKLEADVIDIHGTSSITNDVQQKSNIRALQPGIHGVQLHSASTSVQAAPVPTGSGKVDEGRPLYSAIASRALLQPYPPRPTVSKPDTKKVLHSVCNETKDKKRRKRNVIVSGLEPDKRYNDATLFGKICNSFLAINVSGKINLGLTRRLPSNKAIKPLLVVFEREETAAEVLRQAISLRDATSPRVASVFINPDRTPAEEKLAFEDRERRRARNIARSLPTPPPSVSAIRHGCYPGH